MSRPLRIEFPGALYHVTSRGDGREAIFLDDEDREAFLAVFGEVIETFHWVVHAYCLMGNHYHVLIETPDGNLSRGMRQLNGIYTQRFNRKQGRMGHVFQGRYKAILVQKESHLLELARYVVLNPVRAAMVTAVGDWPWSSYQATAGLCGAPPWLTTQWLLATFSSQKRRAEKRYVAFVTNSEVKSAPWENLTGQIFLGSDGFVESSQRSVKPDACLDEVPTAQRRPPAKPLTEFEKGHARDEAIAQAYASGGYSLKEIGNHFNLHYSRVSRIVQKSKQAKNKT